MMAEMVSINKNHGGSSRVPSLRGVSRDNERSKDMVAIETHTSCKVQGAAYSSVGHDPSIRFVSQITRDDTPVCGISFHSACSTKFYAERWIFLFCFGLFLNSYTFAQNQKDLYSSDVYSDDISPFNDCVDIGEGQSKLNSFVDKTGEGVFEIVSNCALPNYSESVPHINSTYAYTRVSGDFSLYARISDFYSLKNNFFCAGLLAIKDGGNFSDYCKICVLHIKDLIDAFSFIDKSGYHYFIDPPIDINDDKPYVRFTRKGNVLYSFASLDGERWKPIKQTDLSGFGESIYVGLFVEDKDGECFVEFNDVHLSCDSRNINKKRLSFNNSQPHVENKQNVTVIGPVNKIDKYEDSKKTNASNLNDRKIIFGADLISSNLRPFKNCIDLGDNPAEIASSVNKLNESIFTITSNCSLPNGVEFRPSINSTFVYRKVKGNFSIYTKVSQINSQKNDFFCAGLLATKNLYDPSSYYKICVLYIKDLVNAFSFIDNKEYYYSANPPFELNIDKPYVRFMRKENILYSCVSLDNKKWYPIKQTDLSEVGESLYVGLFVADKDGNCFVEFDDVYVYCDEDHAHEKKLDVNVVVKPAKIKGKKDMKRDHDRERYLKKIRRGFKRARK